MITEDYVSFETAKLLKEKGFDEYTFSDYNEEGVIGFNEVETRVAKGYQRPTLQMAMKWLRRKHLLHPSIDMVNGGRWEYEIDDISVPFDGGILPKYYCDKSFNSYEEAADNAIKYSLENLI